MTKSEIIIKACEIVDKLHAAQPGMGACEQRRENRDKANQMIEEMPKNWWKKVPENIVDQFCALS